MNTEKSKKLFEDATKVIPGGVNSPVRAFKSVGGNPLFIKSAKGSKVYDVDGNEYIDFVSSWGPGILGHAHDRVIEAVKNSCDYGLTFGAPTENEVTLANLITNLMPSIEMVRLVSSGTEAVMSAIRVARAFTKKDLIVKFNGCYHGHSDGLLAKAGSGLITNSIPDSAGVPSEYTKMTLLANFNDKKSVLDLFETYGDSIACIIVEPVPANMGVIMPNDDFLKFLRDITQKNDALLIFDEVITGFRLCLGGASEYFGITPDLTTLGKIVGGGMPIGAFGGKKEIMECVAPIGDVYQAGTLSGNPISTTAGIETLTILSENKELYNNLNIKAKKIVDAFNKYSNKRVMVNQIGSLITAFFVNETVFDYESALKSDRDAYKDFFWYMLENGVYTSPSQFEAMFVSDAHSSQDIDRVCELIEKYFKK